MRPCLDSDLPKVELVECLSKEPLAVTTTGDAMSPSNLNIKESQPLQQVNPAADPEDVSSPSPTKTVKFEGENSPTNSSYQKYIKAQKANLQSSPSTSRK